MKKSATLKKMREFRDMLRNGKYTSFGCYPLYLVTADGAALCMDCAKKEKTLIYDAIRSNCDTGWLVVAQDVNWEDTSLYCDHCGHNIESAYDDCYFVQVLH